MAITTYDLAGYATRSDPSTPTVSTDDTVLTHDNIGDLTKVTSPTAGASFTYSYDAFARLVCAKNAAVPSCPTSASPVTWSLDGLDRATSRTDSAGATSYVYRGMSQDAVKITAGTQVSTFAMGLSDAIAQKQGTAVRFYLTDAHDDVVGLVDATGAAKGSVSYSPWGSPIATSGTEQAVLGYQGDLTDPSTHQVDMGTRWYDPGLGQFTSRDSVFGNLKDPTSLNQFAYGNDSPVTYIDPTGMKSCDPSLPKCGVHAAPTVSSSCRKNCWNPGFNPAPYVPPPPTPPAPSTHLVCIGRDVCMQAPIPPPRSSTGGGACHGFWGCLAHAGSWVRDEAMDHAGLIAGGVCLFSGGIACEAALLVAWYLKERDLYRASGHRLTKGFVLGSLVNTLGTAASFVGGQAIEGSGVARMAGAEAYTYLPAGGFEAASAVAARVVPRALGEIAMTPLDLGNDWTAQQAAKS